MHKSVDREMGAAQLQYSYCKHSATIVVIVVQHQDYHCAQYVYDKQQCTNLFIIGWGLRKYIAMILPHGCDCNRILNARISNTSYDKQKCTIVFIMRCVLHNHIGMITSILPQGCVCNATQKLSFCTILLIML